ncbi:MAG: DUF3159 domain-containing protein [Actinomycetota bacterium]|nr:DUF3159 domain-containing protein [Actinomycetota bacterium]
MTSGDGPSRAYGAGDLLANRRVIVDTVVPPVVFVTVSAAAGLVAAAVVAVVLSGLLVTVRLLRRQRLLYAVSGLGGVLLGVAVALWSGGAEGYFVPGVVLNAAYAVAAGLSVLLRRPLIAWASWLIYRWPLAWYWHPRVRPAYSEITWAWAALFAGRAAVRAVLISSGQVVWLTVATLATGWPAFAVLIVATYAYVDRRLARLGGPRVDDFRGRLPATPG